VYGMERNSTLQHIPLDIYTQKAVRQSPTSPTIYVTVKPFAKVAVPTGVVTDTSLSPVSASASMVTFAVIRMELFTAKLCTVIPEPKLTVVVPVKEIPPMVTVTVCP